MRAEMGAVGGSRGPAPSLVLRIRGARPCPQSDRTLLSPPTATKLPTSPRSWLPSRFGEAPARQSPPPTGSGRLDRGASHVCSWHSEAFEKDRRPMTHDP